MPSATATNRTATKPGWGDLFSNGNGRVSLVLAGGVAMYAITVYVTGAVLPAMSAQLHGARLYAWVNTGFLAASIAGTAFASTFTARRGLRQAYLTAFTVFALGSAIIAIAPSMSIVVAGRAVQGIGGGLLSALAYVAVNALLPQSLWGRATGLITAMWGIGGIAGPAVGGIFGTGAAWRTPFVILAVAATALGALAVVTVNDHRSRTESTPAAPASLLVVLAAVVAISLAVLVEGSARLALFAAGVVLLVVFFFIDARSRASLLPRAAYARQSRLGWLYLLAAVLSGGIMIEAFIPLFGQQLGGLSPFLAGYLGAIPSIGWTLGQLFSSSVTDPHTQRRLCSVGPAVTLFGFVTLAISGIMTGPWALWWLPALLAIGAGVGVAFPHLAVAAMSQGRDETESAQISAGISTVELLSNAVFTSLCGLLLATHIAGLTSAQVMAAGLAIIVAIGSAASLPRLRKTDPVAG
ncbi:hypothetical protein BOO86_10000 [Mycobacterium sp. CBMA 234]|uniref:MFS transporter n=1 Tax=Mycolicibacterium sp. CBMA 234 TaxID=1918495 RepID=UPI0012DFD97A|nr:MFS transporter [Mycolicibacterium sp. CBMA 234]MUL64793.1 hypothetical protein [Mycolicibacterium sp. CBMA 234]